MSPNLESLEHRRLMSAEPITVTNVDLSPRPVAFVPATTSARISHTGTLLVEGTSGKDRISILGAFTRVGDPVNNAAPVTTIYVEQTIGDQSVFQSFDARQVKRVYVEARGGNDFVTVGNGMPRAVTMVGGKGNDTLIGGNGGETISGGDGDDFIAASPSVVVAGNPSPGTIGFSTVIGTTPVIASRDATIKIANLDRTALTAVAINETGVNYTVAVDRLTHTGRAAVVRTISPSFTYSLISLGHSNYQVDAVTANESTVFEDETSADSLEGGAGNDTIATGKGPDTCVGGAGTDVLRTVNHGQPAQGLLTGGSDRHDFDGITIFSTESISAS